MKQTYISPKSNVVKIRVAQVMASSPDISLNAGQNVDAASVGSRESSWDIWGNGDDEE